MPDRDQVNECDYERKKHPNSKNKPRIIRTPGAQPTIAPTNPQNL